MKIGAREFKYKKDAIAYFRHMLNNYSYSQKVSEQDLSELKELIKARPDGSEKVGCGIEAVQIIKVRYKTKCFQLIRKDGTCEVFSYRKSINGKTKPTTKFSKTCRETVSEDLREVKCQETNELCKWEQLNVDHRQPNTFSIIVDRFIEIYQINVSKVRYVEVRNGVHQFQENKLSADFKAYHKEKANLRIVKKGANLSRSHQARNTRQKKDLIIN